MLTLYAFITLTTATILKLNGSSLPLSFLFYFISWQCLIADCILSRLKK